MENIKRNKTKGEGSEVVEKMGGGGKKKTEEVRWPLFASALIKATWSSPQQPTR
jgi:hypothetical protein